MMGGGLPSATIKTLGVIDRSIQEGGFLAVASLSRRKAALYAFTP